VFASPDEWASPELGHRVERAAVELAAAVRSGIAREITGRAWGHYQHEYGGNAAQPGHGTDDIDLSTDLMRLATGGGLPPSAAPSPTPSATG
jgi:FMN reductase